MKIFIVHPGMHIKGGAENIVVWLAAGLKNRGHDVTVIAEKYQPDLWAETYTKNLRVKTFPKFGVSSLASSKWVKLWERSRQLQSMLKGADMVIAQLFPSYCWTTMAKEKTRASWRMVWLCQEPLRSLYTRVTDKHILNYEKHIPLGSDPSFFEGEKQRRLDILFRRKKKILRNAKWDLEAARKCDVVLANSAFTAANMEEIFSLKPRVCHLGVPFEKENPYCRGDYLAVLTTFRPMKNVHNVILALKIMKDKLGAQGLKLRIAGQGPDKEVLQNLAKELGVGEHIEFLGRIPDEALSDFFNGARALIYCPIDEPFGLVPLEALAEKTPVIVSNHGGPVETVVHGKTGFHVNPFDPKEIASMAFKLWEDPDLAQAMGEKGCEKTREFYSMDAFLDRFEALSNQD